MFVFIIVSASLFSQNVGINQPIPSEKLDVNGNINLTGTIKTNGVDGLANQILMKNNGGLLAWGDLGSYKNFASFLATGSWIVPTGVTKITIELWGAGGGGASVGGGGGGGYILGQFNVSAGSLINFTVGTNGAGASNSISSGGSGTNSSVTIEGNFISALGGQGVSYNSSGAYFASGLGGGFNSTVGFNSYLGLVGQNGIVTKKSYGQSNATTFHEIAEMGSGGNAANTQNTGGIGVFYDLIIGSNPPINDVRFSGATASKVPGGGGGSYFVNSSSGSNGMIVIHY